jgi:superfamily II DNA or RNA helicase
MILSPWDRGSFMRASPQLSLFPSETTGDAGVWAERLSRAFGDPRRKSGFLELAELAVGACPGDSTVLTLAATAALLDARPERALAFLKRISKRFSATPTDHLLQALALFQEGKRFAARGLLVRHELTEWPAALQVFPGGMERMRWLEGQFAAIMDQAHMLPQRRQPAAAKSKGKPVPASRPERASRRVTPPTAPASAGIAAASLQPLARIDVDISFAAEVDLSPMLQSVAHLPEPEGRWWDLRQRFTHLGFAQGFDELLCLPHLTGVEPLWHQIETVRKVLKQFRGRVLLADEVGLGKTIEAGMVLKEYALRGMAERVLVLSPASLVGQWKEELETKFGLAFATTHDPLLRADPHAFWGQKRIIASIATARRQEHAERLLSGVFDLIIIDEAHHLRDRSSQSWKLVDALNKRFLLLLSATPVQNDLVELYNIMTLLKPGMFRTLREFRAAYITPGKPREPANAERLRELMRGAMIRNTRAVVALKLPRRHAVTIKVDGHPGEVEAYADLAAAARRLAAGTGAGGHRLALHHMFSAAGSSPAAAAAAVARFAARRPDDMEWRALAERWAGIETGGKEMALLDLLRRNPDEKKLVFVHSRETLGRLADLLSIAGLPFARFDGSLSGPQKDAAIADFRDSVPVLLCTESGGEGRNIQFCNTLINFDVPWNPMAIEQRIGRIDRIGQHREVFIFNLVTRGTLEDQLLALLEEKISMFELVVGEVGAILGGLGEERDFPELALDAWLAVTEAGRADAFDLLARQLDEARSQHEGAKALDDALFGDDFETA